MTLNRYVYVCHNQVRTATYDWGWDDLVHLLRHHARVDASSQACIDDQFIGLPELKDTLDLISPIQYLKCIYELFLGL